MRKNAAKENSARPASKRKSVVEAATRGALRKAKAELDPEYHQGSAFERRNQIAKQLRPDERPEK
jgi:hypothetical protein